MRLLNRIKPTLREAPTAVRISYYNATFRTEFWDNQRIYAILIEYPGLTQDTLNYTQQTIKGSVVTPGESVPNSKQIYKGLDGLNQPVSFHFVGVCGEDGVATVSFNGLRPGSKYHLYVTATNPEVFEPTILGPDAQVTMTEFYTLWNPNLRNREKLILDELKHLKPDMYEAICEFYNNEESKKKRA